MHLFNSVKRKNLYKKVSNQQTTWKQSKLEGELNTMYVFDMYKMCTYIFYI